MTVQVRDILNQLRGFLESVYGTRLRHLVLYGSEARGDADAGSDVDVLVLSREVFRRELIQRPDRLLDVLERLAERLADADDLLTR